MMRNLTPMTWKKTCSLSDFPFPVLTAFNLGIMMQSRSHGPPAMCGLGRNGT